MSDNKYPTQVISPFGTALWAHLIEPDTKFNEAGDYKVNLRVSVKDAQALIDQIQEEKATALTRFMEEAKAEGKPPKTIAKIKLSDIDPYEVDDEDENFVVFKFKRKASIIKDSGELMEFDVPLIDASGRNIPQDKKPKIGNGSTIRVMAQLVPYSMPTSGVGISLRLSKVQIRELVVYQADGAGFDAIEDGGYIPEGMDDSFGSTGDGGYSV